MKTKEKTNHLQIIALQSAMGVAMILFFVASATAGPTDGWTQVSYNYNIQTPWDLPQSDRYNYANGEHKFWVYPDDNCQYDGCGTGPRSELRMKNDYLTGRHQFEGEVYITAGTHGTDIMQVFGGVSYSTSFMMKVTNSNGGTIKRYNNETLMTNAYGKWIKVNVQHDAINGIGKIYVYLNNSLVGIFDDRGYKTHYFKCGVYNISGSKSEARWRNVKYWKDGPVGGTGSAVKLYQNCSYGGYAVDFEEGDYTMSELIAKGVSNDDISSLKIASGYNVTLYQHNNYGGNSLTLTADNSCLIDEGFNDDVSSMKITMNSQTVSSGKLDMIEKKQASEITEENKFYVFPNPVADGEVCIKYELHEAKRVTITVNNIRGQRVATVVDTYQPAGHYSATWEATAQSKGFYFVTISYGNDIKTMKLLLQ